MPMCKSKSPKDFGCTLQAGHVGPHQAWGSPTADRPCDEWSNVSDVQEIAYAKITTARSEEHTSELQSQSNLVCRLLLEKKKKKSLHKPTYTIKVTYQ